MVTPALGLLATYVAVIQTILRYKAVNVNVKQGCKTASSLKQYHKLCFFLPQLDLSYVISSLSSAISLSKHIKSNNE